MRPGLVVQLSLLIKGIDLSVDSAVASQPSPEPLIVGRAIVQASRGTDCPVGQDSMDTIMTSVGHDSRTSKRVLQTRVGCRIHGTWVQRSLMPEGCHVGRALAGTRGRAHVRLPGQQSAGLFGIGSGLVAASAGG